MKSNGNRRYHRCTNPGFFDEPKWLSDGKGSSIGADYCSRCLRALMRLYGMAQVTKRGKGIYTTASKETVIDEKRYDDFTHNRSTFAGNDL